MKLDQDIKNMSSGQRAKELMRVRVLIRTHKKKKNNARCWINDEVLYDKVLPEGSKNAGRMTLSKDILLQNCARYISGQQCNLKCPLKKTA